MDNQLELDLDLYYNEVEELDEVTLELLDEATKENDNGL